MSSTAWLLLVLAGVAALVDWGAVARGNRPLQYVCKPATLALLIAVALALNPFDDSRRSWFVVALGFSLLGDVLLMLRPDRLFLAGLGSFLLAHLAYIVGFHYSGPATWLWLSVSAALAVLTAVVARRILRSLRRSGHRRLVVPVVAYMAVITLMVGKAVASGSLLAAAGALLFYLSDSLIGWTRFVRARLPGGLAEPAPRWGPLAIIVTYHLGQAALVVSLA